jgi:hypothetical protein
LLKHFLVCLVTLLAFAGSASAQPAMHDPALPTVKPDALQKLSDNRIRQKIIKESQAPYAGRCVCPYQTRDSEGKSCKGRMEVIKTNPRPICGAASVSDRMVQAWRKAHPEQSESLKEF